MFIAAVLDAFPRFEQRVIAAIDALDAPYPVVCSLIAHSSDEMSGHRFEIEPFVKYFGHIPLAFPQEPARWESVRERLNAAQVGPDVRMHAIKIFELMVSAEASALHIVPERVVFEAGAWNSLAQVVGAAALIDVLDSAQWSVSGFPSGGAVSLTGAAIVDYLCPPHSRGRPLPKARSRVRSGTGFGSLSSHHNCTRLLYFEVDEDAFLERDATLAQTRAARRPDPRPPQ
jgi:hypothetical protein